MFMCRILNYNKLHGKIPDQLTNCFALVNLYVLLQETFTYDQILALWKICESNIFFFFPLNVLGMSPSTISQG